MDLWWALENFNLTSLLDVMIVALVFYGASFFIRGTPAVALLRGVIFLFAVVVLISTLFNLQALQWLLQNLVTVLIVAIPVIFQPELRRALERLGRAGFWFGRQPRETLRAKIIDDVVQAAERLSERRHGALIVLERRSSLEEYIRTGVRLDSEVTPQLLLTVFWPKTELHDGAAIIDANGRVAAASAVLPLSSARNIAQPKLGTRHRAAIGMTEVSDAVCVVVSEETGRISIANGGRLISRMDVVRLRTVLDAIYGPEQNEHRLTGWQRLRDSAVGLLNRRSI